MSSMPRSVAAGMIAATIVLVAAVAAFGGALGATSRPATASTRASATASHPTAAEIERLISGPDANAVTAREAVAICRRIAADFDDRDVARFLHQFGRGLDRAGDPDAAVVMLARVFVLFPESRAAPPALLDAARIHRSHLRDEATAGRLARRAASVGRAMGLAEVAAEAERFLNESPSTNAPDPSSPAAKDPS